MKLIVFIVVLPFETGGPVSNMHASRWRANYNRGAPSSYVKLGMCRGSPHPSTRKKNSRNIWWGLYPAIYGTTTFLLIIIITMSGPSRSGVPTRGIKGLPIRLRLATILSGAPQILTYTTTLLEILEQSQNSKST